MSNSRNDKSEQSAQNVESVIGKIKELTGADCLVLVGTIDPEVSGVIEDDDEMYREFLPLGDGVHVVLSLNLPNNLDVGIHEM